MSFDAQPILRGELLELRPLRASDFDALFRVAADPLIWEQHPERNRCEEPTFRVFFEEAVRCKGALVAVDRASGAIIGSSRFHGYDPDSRVIEIGWTFLARAYWGGRYNGEMKRLMLEHAFRWVNRVIFIIGPDNRRSQRAVEKIGGVRAGVTADAHGCERVVYEITPALYARRQAVERLQLDMTFRLARPDDIEALTGLMNAAIAELQKPFLDDRQIASSRRLMGLDTQLIEDGTYFVVESDGELVGCGGWSRRATLYGGNHTSGRSSALLDPTRDSARIRAMYTHPRHTRRGVGRLIIGLCEDAARTEGFRRMELMSTLAGELLYRRCGYGVVERLIDGRGGVPVPLVRMAKDL